MSNKPVNKSLSCIMDVRCVACFSLDRNLRPMRDTRIMNVLCPGLKFSDYTMVCWECEHTIKKIKQFKARIIKTQTLLKTMSKDVQAGRDSLSNLRTTYTSVVSITENDSEEKQDINAEPIKIKLKESDSEVDNIGNENSRDNMDNWSNTDSCKSFSDMKSETQSYNLPIKRPDNSKTSDWLQQEKLNVPKIFGSCTMTLKDLLDQPLQYYSHKPAKIEKEGTRMEDKGRMEINWEKSKKENINALVGDKKCSVCLLSFYGQRALDEHMKRHSNISNDLFCNICQQNYPNKVLFDDHYSVNHQKKRPAVPVPNEDSPEGAKKQKTEKSKNLLPGITKLLSNTTERKLINWINYIYKHGFEITKEKILSKLSLLLKDDETNSLNSTNIDAWFEYFSTRKYDVSYILPAILSPKVKRYPTENDIQKWAKNVKEWLELNNLSHILNDPSRVFTCEQINFTLENVKKMENGINSGVNVFVNISAEGSMVTPVVFLPDGNTESYTFPTSWVVKCDSNSMDKKSIYDYITNTFYEYLFKNSTQLPVVLFLDEYTSKISLELFDFSKNKDIILFALPANLEYLLKPLNGFFNKVKEYWTTELALKYTTDFGNNIQKCLNDSLNEETIKSNFEMTGLFPFKPIDIYFLGKSGPSNSCNKNKEI